MRTIGVDTLALSAVAVSHHSLAALVKSFTNQPHPRISRPVPARSGSLRFAAAHCAGAAAGVAGVGTGASPASRTGPAAGTPPGAHTPLSAPTAPAGRTRA